MGVFALCCGEHPYLVVTKRREKGCSEGVERDLGIERCCGLSLLLGIWEARSAGVNDVDIGEAQLLLEQVDRAGEGFNLVDREFCGKRALRADLRDILLLGDE